MISHTPAAFLCNTQNTSSDCSFLLAVQISANSHDLGCPGPGSTPQIVLGASSSAPANQSLLCGHVLASSHWQHEVRIPVAATLDLVQDQDVTIEVQVTAILLDSVGRTITSQQLQTVQVIPSHLNNVLGCLCLMLAVCDCWLFMSVGCLCLLAVCVCCWH